MEHKLLSGIPFPEAKYDSPKTIKKYFKAHTKL